MIIIIYAIGDHPGELEILSDVNEEECLQCIQSYPDDIVGVKIRLTAQIANEGKHEKESYRYNILIRYFMRIIMKVILIQKIFHNNCDALFFVEEHFPCDQKLIFH